MLSLQSERRAQQKACLCLWLHPGPLPAALTASDGEVGCRSYPAPRDAQVLLVAH